MGRRVTKAQVARVAGVARSAVSMVLNKRRHTLSESTVQKILLTAKRLGYAHVPQPHIRCVGLIAQKKDFFDPVDDFYQRVTGAVLSELESKDYNAITGFIEDREESGRHFPRVLREGGVDGFVAVIADRAAYDAVLSRVRTSERKAVFAAWVSQDADGVGWVANDDRAGCRAAAEYVAQLGHRRVAILSAEETRHPAAAERFEGHLAGLRAFDVEVPPEWIGKGGWRRDDGRRLMRKILESGRPWPTAVLCSNDWVALGAMDVAREYGIRIPEEMSFVGADDCAAAIAASRPPLTTVATDLDQLGRTTARKLIDWVEAREIGPPTCWVPTRLVRRESVVAPRE